jgi:hypothetical protein
VEDLFFYNDNGNVHVYTDNVCKTKVAEMHSDDVVFYHNKKTYMQDGINPSVLAVVKY